METDIERLLEYSEDGSTVIKCDSRVSGDLNFPENAKRIADYAFSECDNLKSVTFPDNIISIGEHAFEGCKSLTTIYIGAGVRSIGGYAFQGCKRLVKIDISDTVESIGDRAFGCCHALKKIEIPKSVKVMGDGVFDGCTSLKNIIFDGIVEKMGNVEGWMVPGNYNAICGEYLYGYDLYAGYLEYGVDMEINQDFIEDAFAEECKRWSMLTVHIPYDGYKKYSVLLEHSSRMKELYLYEYLTNVTDDDLENGVEDELGVIYSRDGKRLLKGKDIKEYKIKDGTKVICDNAFERCKALSNLILPSSIIRIGHKCFYGCGIKVLDLPNSVKTIADFAFEGCFRLKNITIPHGITSIGDRAFGCCSSLEEITIPQTVKNLGNGVFDGCRELKSIWFMGVVEHIGETSQWLEDGSYSDEDDKYYYGYELEFHLEKECFDNQQKGFQRECFDEILAEWLQRQNNLKIHVPDGYEWYYFKLLNKKSNNFLGESSRPAFYLIMSIMDHSSIFAQTNSVPFIAFCKAFGTPAVREYKSLGFTALICKDADDEETFINTPKSGNALTLVDFSKSPTEIAQQLADNAENLVVLQGTKESDGSPFYTLVDKENYVTNGFIMPEYYEEGTSYAQQINNLHSHSFSDIRDISVRFIQEFDDEEKDELFEDINHGKDILTTNDQLHTYMYCFGLMHEAKLNRAFVEIPNSFFKPSEIEIIDYACGQGIASLCFANFLEDSGHKTRIKKITLIEPSTVALSRAALVCHKVCPDALIETIASEFNKLEDYQISTTEVPRVHLLSNILDMTCYDLNHLARVINKKKNKRDLFVCVDPWYHDRNKDGRQRKLMRLLNGKEIYHDVFNAYQLQEDKSWTAYITIFRV